MAGRYDLFAGLKPFVLRDIQLTNKEVGRGSYATVIEVIYNGMKCAGKEIHKILLEQGDYSYTLRRFEEECQILSHLHHPNIVGFFGVYFKEKEKVPMLVMEFLPMNLTSCIEKHGILPEERSYSILYDVALGLRYLHSQDPPVIHRDLSANNVLLTDNMVAKISDFGVARLINLSPLQASKLTETPGTPDYMPPEAMDANAKYDTSVDEFSFGILMIHTLSGQWPKPQCSQIRMEGNVMIPVSEAERRDIYLKTIGYDHPMMELIRKCVHNNAEKRPHIDVILQSLEALDRAGKQSTSKASDKGEVKRDGVSIIEQEQGAVEKLTEHHISMTALDGKAIELANDNETGAMDKGRREKGGSFDIDTRQELLSETAVTSSGAPTIKLNDLPGKDLEESGSTPFDLKGKFSSLWKRGHRINSPSQKGLVVPMVSSDPKEQQRRIRMVKAAEEDDEIVAPKKRKTKKQSERKGNKSNKSSSGLRSPLSDDWPNLSDEDFPTPTFRMEPESEAAACPSLTESYFYDMTPSSDETLPHSLLTSSANEDTQLQSLFLPTSSGRMGSSLPERTAAQRHKIDRTEESSSSSDSGNEEEDWIQLCGSLLMHSKRTKRSFSTDTEGKQMIDEDRESLSSPPQSPTASQAPSLKVGRVLSPTATISVPISLPSRHGLVSISLSEKLLWTIDSKYRVYFMTMDSNRQTWHYSKQAKMNQISSSSSGNNVWGVFKHNAHVRIGIGMNVEGSRWRNITANTRLAGKIKQIAVDETAVWAITTNGKILFRRDVGQPYPEGNVWQEVEYGSREFTFIACCQNVVWAIDNFHRVYCRTGISLSMPNGEKWKLVHVPTLVSISITSRGVVWGVNLDNSIGFRCGASSTKSSGTGPWWMVCVEGLTPSEPSHSSQVGISIFNSPSALVESFSLLGLDNKLSIAASSKSGVVLLERGLHLHACLTSITGFHYTPASESDAFHYMRWSKLAASGNSLWLVSSDEGHLYSLTREDSLTLIDCPVKKIDVIAVSASHVWILSKDSILSGAIRFPEGDCLAFEKIERPQGIHLRHIACGTKTAWVVGSNGVPYFLFGLQSQKRRSLSWIPVDSNQQPLQMIAVSSNDWLVWACDKKGNVYARTGITTDIPIGQKWELIPERQVRELCADTEKIYALTTNGELICRYGISNANVQGDYWRKMPGKYEHVAVGEFGDLWTMDDQGRVWKQEWTIMKAVSKQCYAQSISKRLEQSDSSSASVSSDWVEI